MSKKIIKLGALSLLLVIISLSIVSCKSNLSFTYDELTCDLIKIELAHRTFSDESEYDEHCEVYKTLSDEETEYVLSELSKITFTTFDNYGISIPDGDVLILHYTNYILYISAWNIEKMYSDNYYGEYIQYLGAEPSKYRMYDIQQHEEMENIISYLKSNS